MNFTAQRTCKVISESHADESSDAASVPLGDFAPSSGYVLIGEPGAGKTIAFRTEADAHDGLYVSVRDFLTYDDKPEWQGTTLYLDGLDEVRAGLVDGRPPLDHVRAKLEGLGRPRFRLSCRWADWLGENDRDHLGQVCGGTLTVLHLDPLSERDIKRILAENHAISDPEKFIAEARERGVQGLLTNPQNLDMLAKAVSGGNWPSSRRETFEAACRMLVTEPNSEHSLVNPTAGEAGRLLDDAGRFCAVQLLAGLAGYTLLDNVPAHPDYPPAPAIGTDTRPSRVLRTRLFVGTSEGRVVPAHRQIAEFLAARRVSGLIEDGLPLERVLALVTGFDGKLLRSFRYFIAWLGVHNRQARPQVSRLNPSGLFYAGGQHAFSTDEKREILANLRREAYWNPGCRLRTRRTGLGPLVSSELQDAFEAILSSADRGYPNEPYVMMVLQALADGEPLPRLVSEVLRVVRDLSWMPGVRCAALEVLIAYREQGVVGTKALLELLGDIDAEEVDDGGDQLLGILLKALFPRDLTVAEVLKYLRYPKVANVGSELVDFWTRHVPKKATDDQRAELLDVIAAHFDSYRAFMTGRSGLYTTMGQLPVDLLSSLLRGSMDVIPLDRLYNWLLVSSQPAMHIPESSSRGIGVRLEWHKQKLKELIAYGVEKCSCAADITSCMRLLERCLFGARPFDYGAWCLDRALSATTERAASIYVCLLADCLVKEGRVAGLTPEAARLRLGSRPVLVELFDERIEQAGDPHSDSAIVLRASGSSDTEAQLACQREVLGEHASLRVGHGNPELLQRAAEAYLGNDDDVPGQSPNERLGRLVGSRTDLVGDLRAGLVGSLARDDLPSPSDVIARSGSDTVPPLVFPYMAALNELERSGTLKASELSDDQVRLAVTILHTVPEDQLSPDRLHPGSTYRPDWFLQVLRDRPRLIADVLRRCIEQKLVMGVLPASELRALAVAGNDREFAELVCLPLLRGFPVESGEPVLEGLAWLLKAALVNCDGCRLEQEIRTKLENAQLPKAQRIYWVASGFLIAPHQYDRALMELGNETDNLGGLLDLLCKGGYPLVLVRRLDTEYLRVLIGLTRASLDRRELTEESWQLMSHLIEVFSSLPTAAATEALEDLFGAPRFALWNPDVADAMERQAAGRHEAEFKHCEMDQVERTLDNGRPANAGDLAALVVAVLNELSEQIRDGSASHWRQYWNVDQYNHAIKPRPENSCRDAMLFALKFKLGGLEINVQSEGTYADDKRSDIQVVYGGFNVPVEIKRSCHRDLWTAIEDQLVSKYTRDPEAEGFGIYLVFWFGDASGCHPTVLEGWTPSGPRVLKSKLTEVLSDQQRSKISVCVVDVSKPGP